MRIHLMSDLHLEHAPMPADYRPPECDVVILAGDISPGVAGIQWANETFAVPVIYVLGNHDYWCGAHVAEQVAIIESLANPNVHVLANNTTVIDGVQFVGATLWTDFDLNGNAPIAKLGNHTKDSEMIRIMTEDGEEWLTPDQMIKEHAYSRYCISEAVRNYDGRSVVVTHYAPSGLSIHTRYSRNAGNPAYASRLENMILDLNPPLWVHGHTHDNFDYVLGDTRVVCNPRGYHGVEPHMPNHAFQPGLVFDL